jgi:hypothetical protein
MTDGSTPATPSGVPTLLDTGLPRRRLAVVLVLASVRVLIGGLLIAAMLALVPEEASLAIAVPALIGLVAIAFYAWFLHRQITRVYRARYPMVQAAEALILVGAMFLAIFSMIYVMISLADPAAFSEPLTPFSAYYYALTVLATVGFGDIAPNTVSARSVSMVQMALDIAFVAVLFRILSGTARKALAARSRRAAEEESADRA